jgi:hypothetical protein
MQGHKQFVDKVVLRFQLSERIPRHNLYRWLADLLDSSLEHLLTLIVALTS